MDSDWTIPPTAYHNTKKLLVNMCPLLRKKTRVHKSTIKLICFGNNMKYKHQYGLLECLKKSPSNIQVARFFLFLLFGTSSFLCACVSLVSFTSRFQQIFQSTRIRARHSSDEKPGRSINLPAVHNDEPWLKSYRRNVYVIRRFTFMT